MNAIAATFPDLEFPALVTSVSLPDTHNRPTSALTGCVDRIAMIDLISNPQLEVMVQNNRNIIGLLGEYFRADIAYANSSFAVTTYALFLSRLPAADRVPARRTPFGHLNFLASPVECLYFDPDDFLEG